MGCGFSGALVRGLALWWALVPGLAPGAPTPADAITATTADFRLRLDAGSQTLQSLAPQAVPGFDFLPWAQAARRRGDGHYQLGDIDLRVREQPAALPHAQATPATEATAPPAPAPAWRDASSAYARRPVRALPLAPGELGAADLAPTLPVDFPLAVERRWAVQGAGLALRFRLRNRSAQPLEIGGLGLPLVFDNLIGSRTLQQAHEQASLQDPYIGRDAGYVQVTRLNGQGPVLLVLPEAGTPLEAYRPIGDDRQPDGSPVLLSDLTRHDHGFEGFFDWMVASRGFAEREWRAATPWNPPSSIVLAPGQTRELGLRFVLAPSIREVEATLAAQQRPVAVGLPGYVIAPDIDAHLYLHHAAAVQRIELSPPGVLSLQPAPAVDPAWQHYRVQASGWGRARVDIRYADGLQQSVHYFVTKPAAEWVADYGRFLSTRQWLDAPADAFGRAPSVLGYDREADQLLLQEPRVWMAGLSDEAGAGAWLGAVAKQLGAPDAGQVAQLDRFVDETLSQRLQVGSGPLRDGVRRSLFFYDPRHPPAGGYLAGADWSTWASWPPAQAAGVDRSYNYPHVAAAYWVMYRLAREHTGLVTRHDWAWYLDRAWRTSLAMPRLAPQYARYGQMEGTVFVGILEDLKKEGWAPQAQALAQAARQRVRHWLSQAYPFASEMPWDSTGQEEVYAWMRYFGHAAPAQRTREAVLAYDPLLPHWAYNGNARRYWDFLYAGKLTGIERMVHHYGSPLNALVLLDAYRRQPDDLHLLRVGWAGLQGPSANVDQEGFASVAFHASPALLRPDPYSGDQGIGFFGLALGTASYLVHSPRFGWQVFGGRLETPGEGAAPASRPDAAAPSQLSLIPRDAFRQRVYIAPECLWLTLEAGQFERVGYSPASGQVQLLLAAADAHTPQARLKVQRLCRSAAAGQPVRLAPVVAAAESAFVPLSLDRGAYTLPLASQPQAFTLDWRAAPARAATPSR